MRKISKAMFVVALTCLLGTGGMVYFAGCAAAEDLLDGSVVKKDGGTDTDTGPICTPICDNKACGDDTCEGSCGSCAATEECKEGKCEPKAANDCTGKACGDVGTDGTTKCAGACPNAGETCDTTTFICVVCEPNCDGAACGDMDSCNSAKCDGTCAVEGQTCNAEFVCETGPTNDCTDKNCGEVGTDGTTVCEGPCADANFECDGGPAWYCKDVTCNDTCTSNSACGDDNGCGSKCFGTCPNATDVCDSTTYACIPDPCTGATCGAVVNNMICLGTCANSAEECRIAADGQSAACVSCNANGKDIGEACGVQADCKCGNNCAQIFSDQTGGECLMDCTADAALCTGTQLCGCSGANANGDCIAGACYETGTLKGTFAGGLTATCNDQPAQTDIGSGNLTVSVPGKTANVTMFYGCIDATGTEPMSLLFGLKQCGQAICPDVIVFGGLHSALKVGVVDFKDGLFAQWAQYTFSGQTTTEVWIRGIAYEGTMTFSQAGKVAKAKLAGSADAKVMKYDLESCGPNTTPCGQ